MADGKPLSIGVRDELKGKPGAPYIRVAGTWIGKTGYPAMWVTVDGPQLKDAAMAQLDLGTDLVKLYMDAPGGVKDSPFEVADVRAAVQAVHARGAKVAAHSGYLAGARVAAEGGVDSIEHGMELDDDTCRVMKRGGVTLVSTLSVFASWETFARTTAIDRFTAPEGRERIAKRKDGAYASIAAAKRAGVVIATGSDFGGGSVRAGHLAWEVELLVDAGLEPYEALAAATRNGGALYGVEHAGHLDEGQPADLVLVHGDPLSDPRALWRVWAVYQRGARVA
jgi:imidazolonepropionase-like amidohydrolase